MRCSNASDLIRLYYCRTQYNMTPAAKMIVSDGQERGFLMVEDRY